MGILVTNPELRLAPTGAAVAAFTVAANDGRYDPDTPWPPQPYPADRYQPGR